LINAAIAITAASVFFSRGLSVTSIPQAHATLEPLLGRFAATVFGLGLLAAGVLFAVHG
jgi:manganese transport protein